MIGTVLMAAAAAAAANPVELTIPGPRGNLGAVLTDPSPAAPVLILVPGSGPTDRDGNNPLGVNGAIYRQLADALAAKGVATLRIDKRGMFSSKAAIPDPNAVVLKDYAADVHGWAALMKARGKPCAWVAGHSEGGLVALVTAQNPANLCGIILIASMGRPLGPILHDQLSSKLPPEMMKSVDSAIAKLEQGEAVDPADLPAPIAPLFNPKVQGFLRDMVRTDPAKLAALTKLPILILWGSEDAQVSRRDFDSLVAARPAATSKAIAGMNHVLKQVAPGDLAANLASYGDADLPIDPAVAEAIAAFVKADR